MLIRIRSLIRLLARSFPGYLSKGARNNGSQRPTTAHHSAFHHTRTEPLHALLVVGALNNSCPSRCSLHAFTMGQGGSTIEGVPTLEDLVRITSCKLSPNLPRTRCASATHTSAMNKVRRGGCAEQSLSCRLAHGEAERHANIPQSRQNSSSNSKGLLWHTL